MKKASLSVYRRKYNAIRKYVKFRLSKNPTAAEKGKVTRYYDAAKIYGIVGEPRPGVYIYTTRSARYLEAAKAAAGMDPGFPAFRVAVFQNVSEGMRKVAVRKGGKITFQTVGRNRREEIYLFADFERYKGEFGINPEAVARRILRRVKSAHIIRFLTGEWITKSYVTAETMLAELGRIKATYGETGRENPLDQYQTWLRGIVAVWFRDPGERKKYFGTIRTKAGRKRQRDRMVAQFWDLIRENT